MPHVHSRHKRHRRVLCVAVGLLCLFFVTTAALSSRARAITRSAFARISPFRSAPAPVATQSPETAAVAATLKAMEGKTCPARYPPDHGLVNTGRRALVMYTFTSQPDLQERQVEIDNFLFFQVHGMIPPNTPTALFSAVDYIIFRVDLNRTIASRRDHGIFECAHRSNVRVMNAPTGPCDLCAGGRVITALGGPRAVAAAYEFLIIVNSGARGPFFTESAPTETHGMAVTSPPVTWIDHLALGGESVYTGAVMTGSGGSADVRPYLQSFALGLPTSLLPTLHPVLIQGGCDEATLPTLWWDLLSSFDADLHKTTGRTELIDKLTKMIDAGEAKQRADKLAAEKVTPDRLDATFERSVRRRSLRAQVNEGLATHLAVSRRVRESLRRGGDIRPPWGNDDRKTKCVVRAELQLAKAVLEAKLPPTSINTAYGPSVGQRKATTADTDQRFNRLPLERRPPQSGPFSRPEVQAEQLSEVLQEYLEDGHYFVRSLHHNATMVSMGHASVVMFRTEEAIIRGDHNFVDPCEVVMLKYGGWSWRSRIIPPAVMARVQELSLLQRRRPLKDSAVDDGVSLLDVAKCPHPGMVKPLE